MRTETYFAGAALVRDLEMTGRVAHVHHDGGDIIHIEMTTSEHAWIHLIDSSIPQTEIVSTLTANAERGVYSLFLIWADRMLPVHGQWAQVEEWMRPLLDLHNGRIYAYEVRAREIAIFPVHFEGTGTVRRIRFGDPVLARHLVCHRQTIPLLDETGMYLWLEFEEAFRSPHAHSATPPHPLAALYEALGVPVGANRRTIKQAYRQLARIHHPDRNADPSATRRMQALNDAYQRLIRALDDDGDAQSSRSATSAR